MTKEEDSAGKQEQTRETLWSSGASARPGSGTGEKVGVEAGQLEGVCLNKLFWASWPFSTRQRDSRMK